MKLKKKIVYRLFNNNTPLTREQLSNYNALSKFFVFDNGEVSYIPPEMPIQDQLKYLVGGRLMYKDQLEELIS